MDGEEKLAWESMLDADMNTRYWGELARRFKARETRAKIFLAISSSGTVASWVIWNTFPVAWKLLSAVSAVVAVALPFFNYPEKIEVASDLHGKWNRLLSQYEAVWAKMRRENAASEMLEAIQPLKEIESTMSRTEAKLPRIVTLVRKCQEEVKLSRGL